MRKSLNPLITVLRFFVVSVEIMLSKRRKKAKDLFAHGFSKPSRLLKGDKALKILAHCFAFLTKLLYPENRVVPRIERLPHIYKWSFSAMISFG